MSSELRLGIKPGWWALSLLGAGACSGVCHAEDQAGKTLMARGEVVATIEQAARSLSRRAPVFIRDQVNTGAQSASQFRMVDGGLLSMQADSQLLISEYEFNAQNGEGSVAMSLLKGGLRTVTGKLNQAGANYQLKTPVASIGVRGTHFEAELVEQDLYLAAWRGVIVIAVTVAGKEQQFELGDNLPHRFAIVRANGDVEFFLNVPSEFALGHAQPADGTSEITQPGLDWGPVPFAPDAGQTQYTRALGYDATGESYIDNDRFVGIWQPLELDDITRSGLVTFDQIQSHSLVSTQGALTNLNMSIAINFDTAVVPVGQFSATDASGEWFAVFNGVIGPQSLDVNINFASHGNALAQGALDAILIDQGRAILGDITLAETLNPGVSLGGGFVLVEGGR